MHIVSYYIDLLHVYIVFHLILGLVDGEGGVDDRLGKGPRVVSLQSH